MFPFAPNNVSASSDRLDVTPRPGTNQVLDFPLPEATSGVAEVAVQVMMPVFGLTSLIIEKFGFLNR